MPLSRRTAGWRTTKGPPLTSPPYPDIQHKAWATQDFREQITPCLNMYFTQSRKARLWTTYRELRIFLPTFYLRCKTTCSSILRLAVHGLLLPLKALIILLFLYFLSFFLFLSCYALSCLSTQTPFLTQKGATFSGLSTLSLSATIPGKYQHYKPVFHRYQQF